MNNWSLCLASAPDEAQLSTLEVLHPTMLGEGVQDFHKLDLVSWSLYVVQHCQVTGPGMAPYSTTAHFTSQPLSYGQVILPLLDQTTRYPADVWLQHLGFLTVT